MGIIADRLRNSTTQASDVYTEMNNAWHEAQDQRAEEVAQAAPSSPSWWDMLVNGDVQGMANAIGLNDTKSGEPYVQPATIQTFQACSLYLRCSKASPHYSNSRNRAPYTQLPPY